MSAAQVRPSILTRIVNRVRRYVFMNYGYPKSIGERISKQYIKKFLPVNPVIIDCGSYDGGDSIEWVQAANAQMHAFEPVPRLYAQLVKNIAPYAKNIACYTVALSNENGKAKFFVSEGKSDGSSSLLQPKEHLIDHPSVTFDESIEVETMTLDSWAAKHNVPKVDMLWLDMQGFELHMLKASKVILDTVKVIHTEVSLKETYEGVGQYNELKDWLATKGFKVQLECIPDGYDMGNVLFVRQ